MSAHSLLQWQECGQLHRLWKRQRLPRARTLLSRLTGGVTLYLLLVLCIHVKMSAVTNQDVAHGYTASPQISTISPVDSEEQACT